MAEKKRYQNRTEVIRDEEGNSVQRTDVRVGKWDSEPPYVKLYIQDIMYLSNLSGRLVPLVMALLKRLTFANAENPMCVVLVPMVKQEILKETGWSSVGSLDNALQELVKGNIIKRIGRGVYQMNPHLFGRGDWKDISRIRLEVSYEPVSNRTFEAVLNDKEYWKSINKED